MAEAALGVLVSGFGLRALAVAAAPTSGSPGHPVARRELLPAGWSAERGLGAILDRHVQALIDDPRSLHLPLVGSRELVIDGQRLWLHRAVEGDRVLAAAAMTGEPLGSSASLALGVATQTLASSLAERGADLKLRHSMHGATSISLKSEGGDVLAEVNADWPLPDGAGGVIRGRRTGVGRAAEPILAVAKAAAKACRPRCEVLYAGTTRGVDGDVTIVLIRHQRRGLRVGWAERSRGDLRGVTEAVFTASL